MVTGDGGERKRWWNWWRTYPLNLWKASRSGLMCFVITHQLMLGDLFSLNRLLSGNFAQLRRTTETVTNTANEGRLFLTISIFQLIFDWLTNIYLVPALWLFSWLPIRIFGVGSTLDSSYFCCSGVLWWHCVTFTERQRVCSAFSQNSLWSYVDLLY